MAGKQPRRPRKPKFELQMRRQEGGEWELVIRQEYLSDYMDVAYSAKEIFKEVLIPKGGVIGKFAIEDPERVDYQLVVNVDDMGKKRKATFYEYAMRSNDSLKQIKKYLNDFISQPKYTPDMVKDLKKSVKDCDEETLRYIAEKVKRLEGSIQWLVEYMCSDIEEQEEEMERS